MVKTEALDPELSEIGWRRFNFPWCTGYSPKRYKKRIGLIIHKDPNDCGPHRLRLILMFDIESNMHNKAPGWYAINQEEYLEVISPEEYGIKKSKAAGVKSLITHLFYNLVRQKKATSTSLFFDLISNYDLVIHNIASLAMQKVNVPKEQINFTFSTLQNMLHLVRTAFGDPSNTYGGDIWSIPLKPPP